MTKMPWEQQQAYAKELRDSFTEIPPALRRDANNKAPFMDPNLCVDEGCPHAGTPHVCINRVDNPPAKAQDWVPPWASTSASRNA